MTDENSTTEAGHEPKISLVEIIFITQYVVLIDAVEILLPFFGLDDFWILDLLALPVIGYLYLKGVNATRSTVAFLLELIPYVGDLPLLTIGFLATVYLDRNPKLEAAVKGVATAKGGVPAAGAKAKSGAADARGAGTGAGTRPTDRPGMAPEERGRAEAAPREATSEAGGREKPDKKESLEETESKVYGMPTEPLSEGERRSIFEETPGKEEARNVPPTHKKEGGDDERVILKDNEVNLKKAA